MRRFIPDLQVLASRADGASGTKGNGNSRNVSINDSGQTLVFSSDATNLDSPDTNGVEDVFMRSGALGASPTTAPISRPENGVEADGPSTAPSIAGAVTPGLNFRVVFETRADNMGADDENDFTQVYSRLAGGALLPPNPARYLSRPDGSGVFRSGVNASVLRATTRGSEPVSSTSADGRYTVFMSQADELSDADDNRFVNVFRRDNQSGETMLISRASGAAGAAGNNESGALEAGALVSAAPAGAPSISADGNRVAFSSAADNLVPGDTNGRADVFVREVGAATTTRVSVLPGGGEIATSASVDPAISRDGNRVAFVTGAAIDPQDGNGDGDVYLRDIGAGVTTLISRRGIGAPSGDDSSAEPALDDDGSHVAFESFASDLAPAAVIDTTPVDPDVYLVNVATGGIQLVNPNAAVPMNTSDDGAFGAALDADASKVAFTSGSTNLGASGNLAGVDVFVRDIPTAQTELVSRTASAPSVSGNGSSEAPSIDAGGQRIAFESVASNLVGGRRQWPGLGRLRARPRRRHDNARRADAGGRPARARKRGREPVGQRRLPRVPERLRRALPDAAGHRLLEDLRPRAAGRLPVRPDLGRGRWLGRHRPARDDDHQEAEEEVPEAEGEARVHVRRSGINLRVRAQGQAREEEAEEVQALRQRQGQVQEAQGRKEEVPGPRDRCRRQRRRLAGEGEVEGDLVAQGPLGR